MKNTFIFLLITLICTGCFITKPENQTVIPQKEEVIQVYDINSLKTTDVTYRLQDKEKVKVYEEGDEKTIQFSKDWFVVHKDILKTMNENQDLLTKLLKKNKNGIYFPKYIGYIMLGLGALMILNSILIFFRKK